MSQQVEAWRHNETWKGETIKQLKATKEPSGAQSKLAYYHCLASCFDVLQDVASKLACWYQIIVVSFQLPTVDFKSKAENLVEFANMCSEKGYITQGIMAFEKVLLYMKDNHERGLLVSWLQELKNERHIRYVATHKEKVGYTSQLETEPEKIVLTTSTSKYRSVRVAEAELLQRRQLRRRKTPYSQ